MTTNLFPLPDFNGRIVYWSRGNKLDLFVDLSNLKSGKLGPS